ncbi:MAG TPA: acetate--CoA ligase family protein [Thermodesulfovibrionales bacterium]|nr:acetate--CoA ligase family protein [Thermodesulfovibrionales bacterium]
MISLDPFFNPRSIALVGAAHTEIKLGGVVLKNLLKFRGEVFPVNPKYNELMEIKAYPVIKALPHSVDLAVVMRPAPEVPAILRELKGRAKCVIIVSSGFAEAGETGLQEEVKRTGREIGVRIIGPNCMGIYDPYKRLDTFFLSYERLKRPKRGNVAVVSQSGGVMTALFSAIRAANIGISKAVGYGNAVDVDESDLYDYLSGDSRTDVVVSYIESVADGRKFIARAKALSERKPLIVLKAGKGGSGQEAAFSHTGRLAGRYEVFRSILKEFGLREANDFEELIDATKALSHQGVPRFPSPPLGNGGAARRVLIITNGGGSGVLAADECMRQGLEVTEVRKDKKEGLRQVFPVFFSINNPVDLTAQVTDEDYKRVLDELRDDYDGFLIIALPNIPGITEDLAGLAKSFRESTRKPMVFHVTEGGISARLTVLLEKARIPVYSSPEGAVRGLKALLR